MRIFRGATELSYSDGKVVKSNDHVVNEAVVVMQKEATVNVGSVIDFKKADGTTTFFSTKVVEKKQVNMWKLRCLTNGYELNNIPILKVYTDKSPEYIVEDIITNYTVNLTYSSTSSSGVTLDKFIARGYLIDVVKYLMDMVEWQIRIDENDNFYFEPWGNVSNGYEFSTGSNFQVVEWVDDMTKFLNHVKIRGGFENFIKSETLSGTNTTFSLAEKPVGDFQVTSVSPDDYTVNAEDKEIVFDTSKTDPVVTYTYNEPVVVDNQDDNSINDYYEVFEEIEAPWLNTFSEARRYSQKLLDKFGVPLAKAKGFGVGYNFNVDVGETVTVVDNERGKTEEMIITKITYQAKKGLTEYEFGESDYVYDYWRRRVEDKIKELTQRITKEDKYVVARNIKHTLKITLAVSETWKENSPVDSFILGHETLGRLRSGFDFEADCSNNGHHGVWHGTDVSTGGQYSTSGYRLSCADLNGSNQYMTVSDSVASVQTCSFYVYPDSLNKYVLRLASNTYIMVDSSGNVVTAGLANATKYVDKVQDAQLSTGSWQLVTVTFDSKTCDGIELGRYSTGYWDGKMDEVMLFSTQIAVADMQTIMDKNFYDDMAFNISGLLAYWSMDNPKLGNRETARTTIT